ncbi:MAG: hypothetical protein IPO08_22705 [Xanthomonadales bacterium]|nr:hypothetical protein [Xanthomonadales bacterium]
MSAASYQRGSQVVQRDIDNALEVYRRNLDAGTAEGFVQRLREELKLTQNEVDRLSGCIASNDAGHALAMEQSAQEIRQLKTRLKFTLEMLQTARVQLSNLAAKHQKLSALFRFVCTPERYQALSSAYDDPGVLNHDPYQSID